MRVVVLQTLGLGDFLTALPAIRAVRKHFSNAHITWMGKSEYLSLAEPIFDDVFHLESLADAPRLAFDVGINFHGSGPHSHEVLSACSQVIAFFDPVIAPDGPIWSSTLHIRSLWIELLEHYGIDGDPYEMWLQEQTPSHEEILIHVGARDRDRWWPIERFREVIKAFPDSRVIAAKSDQSRALEISDAAEFPTLEELRELVSQARLVIGVDSGVAHLAYALRRPTVTMFGPAPASRWGPPPFARHMILGNYSAIEAIHPDGPCSPHLLEISAIDLVDSARKQLSKS